jgi:predicted component of type VI protein secretion system
MLGHLVPCSGGKSIALRRTRVYLGRRPQVDKSLPLGAETALCRLQYSDGWWYVDDLGTDVVRINGHSPRSERLVPGDELTIGKMRFRILYDPPAPPDAEEIAAAVLAEDSVPPRVSDSERETVDALAVPLPAVPPPASGVSAEPQTIRFQPARLVPLGGGPDFLVSQPRVTIGRKENCDIVLPFSTVSGMHCGLEFVEGYWRVLDLDSRNGIRVDGIACKKAWVYPESRLSIADKRFELDYVPQGERPEPLEAAPPYSKPLMATLGISQSEMNKSLARHSEEEQDEPQRKRYDLLDNL